MAAYSRNVQWSDIILHTIDHGPCQGVSLYSVNHFLTLKRALSPPWIILIDHLDFWFELLQCFSVAFCWLETHFIPNHVAQIGSRKAPQDKTGPYAQSCSW
jgi:hypothetical protein